MNGRQVAQRSGGILYLKRFRRPHFTHCWVCLASLKLLLCSELPATHPGGSGPSKFSTGRCSSSAPAQVDIFRRQAICCDPSPMSLSTCVSLRQEALPSSRLCLDPEVPSVLHRIYKWEIGFDFITLQCRLHTRNLCSCSEIFNFHHHYTSLSASFSNSTLRCTMILITVKGPRNALNQFCRQFRLPQGDLSLHVRMCMYLSLSFPVSLHLKLSLSLYQHLPLHLIFLHVYLSILLFFSLDSLSIFPSLSRYLSLSLPTFNSMQL